MPYARPMAVAFLSARWSNLILVTYAFDPAVLAPILPPGCVADVVDGRAFASLVAFDFLDCRVLGVRWPGFVNFPEVNLRAYVRDAASGQRGVTFVGEFVPQRFVAWCARTLYGEPYRAVEMSSAVAVRDGAIDVRHALAIDGRPQSIRVVADADAHVPPADGPDHFFKEHAWGFNRSPGGRRRTYHVVHPRWAVHAVRSLDLDYDFARAYGDRWAFLDDAEPHRVTLAAGSAVKVYPWRGEVVTP